MTPSSPEHFRPRLLVELELEERAVVRLVAGTHEDELRLRRWVAHEAVRVRLHEAIADVLEEWAA